MQEKFCIVQACSLRPEVAGLGPDDALASSLPSPQMDIRQGP